MYAPQAPKAHSNVVVSLVGRTISHYQVVEGISRGGMGIVYRATDALTPIEYVRSFYYLGQIAEKKGDRVKAREHYGKFVSYWNDGDIDREKVAEAKKKSS